MLKDRFMSDGGGWGLKPVLWKRADMPSVWEGRACVCLLGCLRCAISLVICLGRGDLYVSFSVGFRIKIPGIDSVCPCVWS